MVQTLYGLLCAAVGAFVTYLLMTPRKPKRPPCFMRDCLTESDFDCAYCDRPICCLHDVAEAKDDKPICPICWIKHHREWE